MRRHSSLKPRVSPPEFRQSPPENSIPRNSPPKNFMPRPLLSQAPPTTASSINRNSNEQPVNVVVASPSTISNGENKVVRRKLLDAKSELKQQIFGFHIKPKKALDFPIGITKLLFEKTNKILDTYEEYYKTKGLRKGFWILKIWFCDAHYKIPKRSPTRPELLLDNFEKTCEKVKNDIHEQELKAIQKSVKLTSHWQTGLSQSLHPSRQFGPHGQA